MKGLLLKDFYAMLRTYRIFAVVPLVCFVVIPFSDSLSFFIVYPVFLTSMISANLLSADEKSGWNVCADALPYSRKQIVVEKYLFNALVTSVAFALTLLAFALRFAISGGFVLSEFFVLSAALLAAGLLIPAVCLPFIFWLGTEKGRLLYYTIVASFTASVVMLAGILLDGDRLSAFVQSPLFPALLAVGTLAAYAVSCCVSVSLYKKREL